MINEFDCSRLAVFREMRGMTQEQVAELMKIKKQAIHNWEVGKVCPSAKNLAKYCTALGINVGGCFRVGA